MITTNMNVVKKRAMLIHFCDAHDCADGKCPLHTKDFKCGRGYHFINNRTSDGYLSDDIVEKAYAVAFAKDPQEAELLETNDGIFIHMSGADINMIDSINIYFKEEEI